MASINISFGNNIKEFNLDEYERVLYSLQLLYGKGNKLILSHQDFELYNGRKWVGKSVSMELLRFFYIPKSRVSGYIFISDNNLNEKRIKDEF